MYTHTHTHIYIHTYTYTHERIWSVTCQPCQPYLAHKAITTLRDSDNGVSQLHSFVLWILPSPCVQIKTQHFSDRISQTIRENTQPGPTGEAILKQQSVSEVEAMTELSEIRELSSFRVITSSNRQHVVTGTSVSQAVSDILTDNSEDSALDTTWHKNECNSNVDHTFVLRPHCLPVCYRILNR